MDQKNVQKDRALEKAQESDLLALLLGNPIKTLNGSHNTRAEDLAEMHAGSRNAVSVSVSSYELCSCWPRRPCSPGILHPFWFLHSLCLLYLRSPWTLSRRLWWRHGDILFKNGCAKVSHSLCKACLWVSLHQFPSAAAGGFSDDGWTRHWSTSIADSH